MEQINERKMFVKIEIEKDFKEVEIPVEVAFLLWGKPELMGLLIGLIFLSEVKVDYIPQPSLAKLFNLYYGTYLSRRKELEKLKLLRVEIERHNFTKIYITFGLYSGLWKNHRGSMEKPETPKKPEELLKYIEDMGQFLIKESNKRPEIVGQLPLSDNIYINTNKTNSNINTSIINKRISVTSKSKTYPKEDYTLVIDAFKKYKGVGLVGPEIAYHLRAIKLMFQAEHKPKEIIDFMKWLHDNEKNEETPWVRNWTIWTVQKKIPEFLGGKLKVRSIEEEFPAYGK